MEDLAFNDSCPVALRHWGQLKFSVILVFGQNQRRFDPVSERKLDCPDSCTIFPTDCLEFEVVPIRHGHHIFVSWPLKVLLVRPILAKALQLTH